MENESNTPLFLNRPRRLSYFELRFWSNVDIKGQNDCWEWRKGRDRSGYGRGSFRKIGEIYAHRAAYSLYYEKSIKNHILHSCDNPPCCNPRHLRDDTHSENVRDRENRGRGYLARKK